MSGIWTQWKNETIWFQIAFSLTIYSWISLVAIVVFNQIDVDNIPITLSTISISLTTIFGMLIFFVYDRKVQKDKMKNVTDALWVFCSVLGFGTLLAIPIDVKFELSHLNHWWDLIISDGFFLIAGAKLGISMQAALK